MNYEAVYRTAPATPGLLKMLTCFLAAVLLSASAERFGVSRMQDFLHVFFKPSKILTFSFSYHISNTLSFYTQIYLILQQILNVLCHIFPHCPISLPSKVETEWTLERNHEVWVAFLRWWFASTSASVTSANVHNWMWQLHSEHVLCNISTLVAKVAGSWKYPATCVTVQCGKIATGIVQL